MKKIAHQQSGFGTIEALLITIVILLVGFIGYYVWHTQSSTNKNAVSSSSTPAQTHVSKVPGTNGTTSQQDYLVIKEWGVKIPLSSNISTAYYSYSSDGNFVTLSLNKYKGTNCTTDLGQIYGISRSTNPNGSGENSTTPGVKIGNYYYFAVHPQAGCDGSVGNGTWDPASAGAAEAMAYVPLFKEAVSKIVAE